MVAKLWMGSWYLSWESYTTQCGGHPIYSFVNVAEVDPRAENLKRLNDDPHVDCINWGFPLCKKFLQKSYPWLARLKNIDPMHGERKICTKKNFKAVIICSKWGRAPWRVHIETWMSVHHEVPRFEHFVAASLSWYSLSWYHFWLCV